MKKKRSIIFAALSVILAGYADAQETPSGQKNRDPESEKAQALDTHREGSEQAAEDQDKQAANASELIDEQTNAKVIELLNKVESLMGETTDRLEDGNTGGDTIAIQTEIIETIFEAAKEKSKGGD